MKIVAESRKIGDILRDGKIYAIPIFQRSFSWEDQQIMEFWEDIVTVYK
ncbi:MAG TPA: DUF262 domain-containing protein, partial [Candidatus Bathyarchaeota archaeon]|nr:DUF262 domain-containing protein [Candidatus Bathyarchaeota archaeon]